ncbi:MAG: MBL fold metallo-hydrolase [Bacteroidales bacterium]|jgi:glyoxylase-like metal-dependent hydrolase (beta-lactamase superfamily II)|nr:MBL fold metallo-hydrolase [Bacteroidales bacterium]NCU36450.1 MBL fold metallo-hydrolase [Candidatus Falkowbacteria bacterium]MDD2632730.1 MBL fold metallo-hydrolase [Bacteroidales bacterium]MDD3132380.1 MBL fold metallo-hydrolase [Bacteroidales bacterium]MDD3526702.1 MBL fold metallo-hydrolase [Bacteroidales bacterium]
MKLQIHRFIFNPFQENTYVLYDESKEAVIVDAGCSDEQEGEALSGFIQKHQLKPVAQILTHGHIDHVMGVNFVWEQYGLKPKAHADVVPFLENATEQAQMFGVKTGKLVMPERFLEEGDQVKFGKSVLEVLHTPGHAAGHLCFVSHSNNFVLSGDVLFRGSIGRTDLPTGDYDLLEESIRTKLYTLPEDFVVYPGHGPETSIGIEMKSNPFVMG